MGRCKFDSFVDRANRIKTGGETMVIDTIDRYAKSVGATVGPELWFDWSGVYLSRQVLAEAEEETKSEDGSAHGRINPV